MGAFYGLTPSQVNAAESSQWKQILRQTLADVRTAIPAFLVEDIGDDQTVTVQIAIQERVRPSKGKAQWHDIDPVIKVPVVMPRGGGYSVTLPLKKGDEGLLVFCYTCFDNWFVHGQDNAPLADNVTTPSGSQRQFEVRRHEVQDCGFIPGMWSQPHVLPAFSTDSLQIRSDDGQTVIDVSNTNGITITSDAVVQAQANGGTPQTLMTDTFFQWYKTNIQPFLVSKGYAGPGIPVAGCETTILKGQ